MHLGDLVINVALDHRASPSFGHYEIVMFVWKKIQPVFVTWNGVVACHCYEPATSQSNALSRG